MLDGKLLVLTIFMKREKNYQEFEMVTIGTN